MGRKFAAACNRELGAELQKRREGAGLTGKDMASYLGWTSTTVSRVETGHADISLVDMIHYLGACKVCLPEINELRNLYETTERNLGYWLSPNESLTSLVFHESTANQSISYEPFVIPGLLQTAAYAKARMSRWSPASSARPAAGTVCLLRARARASTAGRQRLGHA